MIKTKRLFLVGILISGLFISLNIFGEESKKLKVIASSMEQNDQDLKPENVIDGDMGTRWGSEFGAQQWIMIDLGEEERIQKVILYWENAYAKAYKIQVSNDSKNWNDIYSTTNGDGDEDEISFKSVKARYVRMYGTKRGIDWAGYSLFEFEVYGDKVVLTSPDGQPKITTVLKNPSFEKGKGHWEKSGNAKSIDRFNWHNYDGQFSYGIGNDEGPDNAYGEIYQEIKIPGKKIKTNDLYIFKMWMKSENKYGGKASLKLIFLDSNDKLLKSYQSKILKDKFEWTKLIVSGKAPKGTKKVIAKCLSQDMPSGQGGTFLWVDNASVDCPNVIAKSFLKSLYSPINVMDEGKWHSKYSDNQWLTIDFQQIKKFTGLVIDWDKDYAKKYEILISIDGQKWDSIYTVQKNIEGIDNIYLDETYAQFIKIKCNKSSTNKGFGINEIETMEPSALITIKKYFKLLAKRSPDYYPRWLLNKQTYWTIVGIENDINEATISEDGALEPFKRGFIIDPFLYLDDKLITKEDAKITQSLEKVYLPIPSVVWKYNDVEMKIKLFAYGKPRKSIAYARYTIKNTRDKRVNGKLYLTVRPFQIYPPWQGGHDGFSAINKIEYSNNVVQVNEKHKIFPLIKPDGFGAVAGETYFKFPFKVPPPPALEGDITDFLRKGIIPEVENIVDKEGFASSVMEYDFDLAPGEYREFYIAIPLHKKEPDLNVGMDEDKIKTRFNEMVTERIAFWESKVNKFDIDIPEQDLINALKANAAYNLITRDGPALQPGARSYDKAWWRDGSIQASSLLKVGIMDEPRDFINWMSSFQYDTGEVPPIIDNKAKDPLWELKPPHNLKEYDSQGQLIWAVLEYYYFSNDKKFLEKKWKNVYKSLKFMEELRKQRLTSEYNVSNPEKRRFYGILPQSRSHEGYWFAHSYWDDWWALKGWKDAKRIAEILKKKKSVIKWIDEEYNAFLKDLCDSIKTTAKFKNVNYISGCAEKGDFDPTSTATAINYSGELENMEKYLQPYLKNTFERYWKEIKSRLEPGASYHYTPYEARNIPAFLYMGQKERALALLRFLLRDSRPYYWYQLAEVANSDYRLNYYVGDMPHTWCGAEFMNSVRGLFVYEKDDTIILGEGIDEKWLDSENGVSVKDLPTYFGKVNYTMKKENGILKIMMSGKAKPKDGFIFRSPFLKKKISDVKINGRKWKKFTGDEIIFNKLPVEIIVYY